MKSKDKILSSALDLFMNQGVESTTIADIRDNSGVSIGSIYHHFKDKEGIVAALFMSAMEDHSIKQIEALKQAKSAEEGVKAVVLCYLEWIIEHPDWAKFVFRYKGLVENSRLSDDNRTQRQEHFAALKNWFAPYLEAGDMKRLPTSVYHSLIIGPAQDMAMRWLKQEVSFELKEFTSLYAETAWRSVQP